MATTTTFSFLSSSISPRKLHVFRSRSNRTFSTQAKCNNNNNSGGVAVVWFKHDLRVDDHPALVSASTKHRNVVPVYVFDHRILSRFSDEVLELVLYAVKDLRNSLLRQGSNLMVKFGTVESILLEIVKEVKATHVFAEEEVEYCLRGMMDVVRETLITVCPLEFAVWRSPFYDIKNSKDLPVSYDEFEKLGLPITSPLPTPTLPGAGLDLDWGLLPTIDDLRQFMNEKKTRKYWISLKDMSAEAALLKLINSQKGNEHISNFKCTGVRRAKESVFVTRDGNYVGGGTDSVLNALAAYLRYSEGTTRDDWQEVHEKLRSADNRDGTSFTKIFGPALCLGIVSRRRVYSEAIRYEKERNAGFLSPFGYSAATVAAAIDAVGSMEWYWLMALKCQKADKRKYSIRIWRWNGYLIQYTAVGHEGPAILLVHGFGAFLDHYRDNICGIAEGGYRVWSITMLGFGKSEKPNLFYTELLWAELLRDFIVDVVGESVHIVGNSIGGYIVAIASCLWPALVKSVVLINSAGDVIPRYSLQQLSRDRQTSGVAWLGARLILVYLRSRIKEIVTKCYPTKTERVDDWLISEMLRASYDPGGVVILESIFSINLSLPLNFLLGRFEDKVFVVQGMKDPISDSRAKLAMFREHFRGAAIRELDAGHCPHDELPEEVNAIISEWVSTLESGALVGSSS